MSSAYTNYLDDRGDHTASVPVFQTSDASPIQRTIFTVPDGSTVKLDLVLLAREPSGLSKCWRTTRTGKNQSGVLSLVGTAPTTVIEADAGAASWSAALSAVGSDVVLTTTGVAGLTISWAICVASFILIAT